MSGGSAVAALVGLGLVAGVLGGMFGIGGGLIIVPALVLFFGLDQKTATGTSLFIILLPTGLFGVFEFWRRGQLRADYGLWIALGVLFGAYVGARLIGPMPDRDMKRLYGIFLLIVGIYYVTRTSSPADPPPKPAASADPPQVH
jgi:uncharacterized membrane protein YfcA